MKRSAPRRSASLGGSMVWFAGSLGVASVGYLAVNAAASRLLGPAEFGDFVVLFTAALFLGQFGLAGVHRSGLREAARLSETDHNKLAELRAGVRAVTLIALPVTGVLAGLLTWFYAADRPPGVRMVLGVEVAALVVLGGHQKLWSTYLRGFGQVRFASLLEGRSGGPLIVVSQAAGVLVVLLLLPGSGLMGALGAVAVGYVGPVLWAYRRVRARWRGSRRAYHLIGDLRCALRRDWKFASSQTASALNANVEIWIAGLLLSATDSSLFGASQRLAALLIIPLFSIQVVFAPAIARLTAAGDRSTLGKLLRTGALLGFAVSLVTALPLLVAPAPVLAVLYGPGFAAGAGLLVVLALGYLSGAFAGLTGPALSMTHNEGVAAAVNWIALVVRIPLGVAAVMLIGVEGLGISATFVTTIMYAALCRRSTQLVGLNMLPTLRPSFSVMRRIPG